MDHRFAQITQETLNKLSPRRRPAPGLSGFLDDLLRSPCRPPCGRSMRHARLSGLRRNDEWRLVQALFNMSPDMPGLSELDLLSRKCPVPDVMFSTGTLFGRKSGGKSGLKPLTVIVVVLLMLQGCTAMVVGTAVGVAGTVVVEIARAPFKVTGAVVDVVSDNDEADEDDQDLIPASFSNS